jgi:hypothetical protein
MNLLTGCYFVLRDYDKLFIHECYYRNLFALWLEIRITVLLEGEI